MLSARQVDQSGLYAVWPSSGDDKPFTRNPARRCDQASPGGEHKHIGEAGIGGGADDY